MMKMYNAIILIWHVLETGKAAHVPPQEATTVLKLLTTQVGRGGKKVKKVEDWSSS